MATLRTEENAGKYRERLAEVIRKNECVLCSKTPLKGFSWWKIVSNDFPYDKIAKTHDMLVPLRHISEFDLTQEELKELKEIKDGYINSHYEYLLESTARTTSLPDHYHLHLMVTKDSL